MELEYDDMMPDQKVTGNAVGEFEESWMDWAQVNGSPVSTCLILVTVCNRSSSCFMSIRQGRKTLQLARDM